MAQVLTGSTFHVVTAFAASKVVAGISNAAEAVVNCPTHDYSVGDIVEITSGWGRLNLRAFRVKSVIAATSFVLEGADTTNTNFFATGTGGGSVRKVMTFTQVLTVMNPTTSGGEPKKVEYKFVESDVSYSINDGFSAVDYAMDLDADSIGSAGYNALKALTDVQTNTILKVVTRSGSLSFQPCTVALNEAVTMADGQINKVKASFSGNNRGTRYAA